MKGEVISVDENVLLDKLKEANGNTLVLGFNSDTDVKTTVQTAEKLRDENKIEIVNMKENDDNSLEIKAYVK